MMRNALAQVGAYIVIIGGLPVPAGGHVQSNSPYDNQYSPAKNNCATPSIRMVSSNSPPRSAQKA
jgi:hypothetical protein